MRLFVLITILVMTTTMGYAQDENINLQNHFLLANGHVEHIGYIPFKKDNTEGVKRMDIVRRDEQGRYVMRVELNDGLSYWYFSLKNAQLRYNILTAEIGDNVTYNTHRNSYDEEKHMVLLFPTEIPASNH